MGWELRTDSQLFYIFEIFSKDIVQCKGAYGIGIHETPDKNVIFYQIHASTIDKKRALGRRASMKLVHTSNGNAVFNREGASFQSVARTAYEAGIITIRQRQSGDYQSLASDLTARAKILSSQGRCQEARSLLEEALSMAKDKMALEKSL